MKKRLIRLLTLLLILNCFLLIHGRSTDSEKTGKSFLWEVDTRAGKSYLLGSVHMLTKESYPLKKVINDAYANTDVLVVEANVDDAQLEGCTMSMMQKAIYKGSETLEKNISPKTYHLARIRFRELGMDINSFQKFKPWIAGVIIYTAELTKLGFQPQYGLDLHFFNKAKEEKKEILELEGLEFQLTLFDNFSKKESEEFLRSSIVETDMLKENKTAIIDAWNLGDVKKMEGLLNAHKQEDSDLQAFFDKILTKRNERMIEKIQTYFMKSTKTHFIIVGAAHLIGEKGLIQLLKNKGFTLKQL